MNKERAKRCIDEPKYANHRKIMQAFIDGHQITNSKGNILTSPEFNSDPSIYSIDGVPAEHWSLKPKQPFEWEPI